jgi:hypothetical protein
VTAILHSETERRKSYDAADGRRAELELKKLELEIEHAAELGEERRKDRAAREELREMRRANAARAREIKKQKNAGGQHEPSACKVCVNSGDPTLSAYEIMWHARGHRAALPGEDEWPRQ